MCQLHQCFHLNTNSSLLTSPNPTLFLFFSTFIYTKINPPTKPYCSIMHNIMSSICKLYQFLEDVFLAMKGLIFVDYSNILNNTTSTKTSFRWHTTPPTTSTYYHNPPLNVTLFKPQSKDVALWLFIHDNTNHRCLSSCVTSVLWGQMQKFLGHASRRGASKSRFNNNIDKGYYYWPLRIIHSSLSHSIPYVPFSDPTLNCVHSSMFPTTALQKPTRYLYLSLPMIAWDGLLISSPIRHSPPQHHTHPHQHHTLPIHITIPLSFYSFVPKI